MKRLIKRSDIGIRHDSVKHRHKVNPEGMSYGLLHRCNVAWENLRKVRETRQRVMDYCYGDQWGDVIEWKGETMSEREYIHRGGNVALTNNVMVSILDTIVGLYAKQQTEPVCFARVNDAQPLSDMMSATIQENWQITLMPDVLKTVFEDSLLGGVSAVRETYEMRNGKLTTWSDYVNPNYLFWEGGSDPRYMDFRLIGLLHDMSRNEVYQMFANAKYGWTTERLDEVFGFGPYSDGYLDDDVTSDGVYQNDRNTISNVSFEIPSDRSLVRVIEVWTKETKRRLQVTDPIAVSSDDAFYRTELSERRNIDAANAERVRMYAQAGISTEEVPLITYEEIQDEYWYYTYMAPDGTVLCEGESPYDFKSHPFTVKLYPYVNGEIHPYMGNIVDQQRYINRLIVMHDMAARSSAKGITIVPIDCIPDEMSPRDFADQFTSYDGLIFYDTARQNPNLRPEIITSNAVQIGTTELLNMQLQLVRDVANVSGALQGKTPTSGTSAARYSMETQNSSTSLYTLFSDMTTFAENVAYKKCAVIKQYYPDHCYVMNKDHTGVVDFDRMSLEDVMFKISIRESAATAAYQTYINDTLDKLLSMGLINIIQYLRHSNLPFGDSLLQDILSEQQAAMEAGEAGGEVGDMGMMGGMGGQGLSRLGGGGLMSGNASGGGDNVGGGGMSVSREIPPVRELPGVVG